MWNSYLISLVIVGTWATMQTIVIIMVDHYNNDYDLVGNTSMTIITMLVLINIIDYLNGVTHNY